MRIALADPHVLVRAGVRLLVESQQIGTVVGEAADGESLLDTVVENRPDLVISEVGLPRMTGFEMARRIRRHFPDTKVMFLSGYSDSHHVRGALRAGARGYVSKSADPEELRFAIRIVQNGQVFLSPSVSQHWDEGRRNQASDGHTALSTRQKEVLKFVGKGKSTKEIARVMGVSHKTVETHRARLMHTLGLRTSGALVHYAVRLEIEGRH